MSRSASGPRAAGFSSALEAAWRWYWGDLLPLAEVARLSGMSVRKLRSTFQGLGLPLRPRGGGTGGTRSGRLTDADLRAILDNPDSLTQAELGAKYGVTKQRVSQIWQGHRRRVE